MKYTVTITKETVDEYLRLVEEKGILVGEMWDFGLRQSRGRQ